MRKLALAVSVWAIGCAVGLTACGGLKTTTTSGSTDAATGTTDAAVPLVDAATTGDASGTDLAHVPTGDAGSVSKAVYIAGGQDVRRVASFDGKTFGHDVYVAPTGADNAFSTIIVADNKIVGVADSGIYISTDGLTWTIVPKPTNVSSLHGAAGTFGNGKFVVVSNQAAYTSTDGMTWTVTNTPAQTAGHWHDMAFGNGHYVAIGDNCRKVSEDGATWHDFVTTTIDPNNIAFGNGIFIVTATDAANTAAVGYTITSKDGVTWTAPVNTVTSYATGLSGIAYGANKFVTGDCCNAFSSTDGTTWTKIGPAFGAGKLTYSSSGFVGIGWRTNVFVSADGTNFKNVFSDDGIDQYNPDMQAPWMTTVGSGYIAP